MLNINIYLSYTNVGMSIVVFIGIAEVMQARGDLVVKVSRLRHADVIHGHGLLRRLRHHFLGQQVRGQGAGLGAGGAHGHEGRSLGVQRGVHGVLQVTQQVLNNNTTLLAINSHKGKGASSSFQFQRVVS